MSTVTEPRFIVHLREAPIGQVESRNWGTLLDAHETTSFLRELDAWALEIEKAAIAKHTQTVMDVVHQQTVDALVDAEMRGYGRKVSKLVTQAVTAAGEKRIRKQAFSDAVLIALATGGPQKVEAADMRQAIAKALQAKTDLL